MNSVCVHFICCCFYSFVLNVNRFCFRFELNIQNEIKRKKRCVFLLLVVCSQCLFSLCVCLFNSFSSVEVRFFLPRFDGIVDICSLFTLASISCMANETKIKTNTHAQRRIHLMNPYEFLYCWIKLYVAGAKSST